MSNGGPTFDAILLGANGATEGQLVPKRRRQAPEKRIQERIKKNLELMGFDVSRLAQAQRAQMTPGIPDLYARHRKHGIRLWIEVKTPKGKTSPFQDYWIGTERACGGNAIVARSMEDVIAELRRLGMDIR